ncbi:putative HD phosphohydrolase [Streptomyces griseochromogenes]|uniref:HD phosphohydrolase n=1 Tax=Streptomyces griseochromogenes TaxID=68214 RepID=A0A1B1BCT0_9ACTN|nr:HD domain-containing protein [Streptomyces griseochromogenes]ANP56638.1 metal-dependent phosphohydrolase [Streptomyces griseochromogenes]MBP2056053.1 putative HD phosphohydrolase [Streptomyces griseochromogenes]
MTYDRIPSVDELMALLADCADAWDRPDRSGDPVAILDHGLQVASVLAERNPQDEELQVAGLVHDIGHYLVPGDEEGHGTHAARAVEDLLGPRVARLVALHIPAKRYLATADPDLVLSPESARTLGCQGGPLTRQEAAAFEADPDFAAAVALRRADDAGKVVGLRVEGLESWRPVVERVAAAAR